MKYLKHITLALIILTTSCTDVIDVDLQTEAPKLVIEASIDWEKGTEGNNQTIKLSTSKPYFDTTSNTAVTGALVKVVNDLDLTEYVFTDQNNGTYTTNNFVPVIGQSYSLEVVYGGETYLAQETLMPVVDIEEVNQSLEGGFNDEALEVNIYFQDPADEENFYLLKFHEQGDLLVDLEEESDEFTNGNLLSDFYEKENDEDTNQKEFEAGDVVDIWLYGISKQYHNYMRLFIEQYYSGEDPFATAPVELRGNCVNITKPDNYAYGYFRLTQVVKTSYTFE